MKSLKIVMVSLLYVSCYSLNGMHALCLEQQQKALERLEINYKKTLATIKLNEPQEIYKKNLAKKEYDGLVRAEQTKFHMCFAGHLANNAH